jgi:hypothetical protein
MIQRFLLLSVFAYFPASSGIPQEAWPPRMIRRVLSAILGAAPTQPCETGYGSGPAGAVPRAVPSVFRCGSLRPVCSRDLLGTVTTQRRQEFVGHYEDYVVAGYSTALRALGGASFEVLGSPVRQGRGHRIEPGPDEWRRADQGRLAVQPDQSWLQGHPMLSSTASARPARSTPTWSQSSCVTTGTCRPCWLPCSKKNARQRYSQMIAKVSCDHR